MSAHRILVVDDDRDLRQLIAEFLEGQDFAVDQAASVAEMRQHLAVRKPDCIVLDLMMPGEDGLSALRKMDGTAPPVIMLSAMGSDVDRIIGLELGADDYLAKPCNPRELLARIRALLRRSNPVEQQAELVSFGGWQMDLGTKEVIAPDGAKVSLARREWQLLSALVQARRRVLSRETLMTHIGEGDDEPFDRAIDIAISRLRRKLSEHDSREIVRTVRGEGYGLSVDVEAGEG